MKTIIILALCATATFATRLPFRPSQHTSGRIVGGQDAAPGQFPYIASLRFALPNWHLCGASLINENYAVTAGHCCKGETASNLVLVAGTNKLNEGGEKYPIEELILHPSYKISFGELENDICLIRLGVKVSETDLIKFVALNRDTDDSAKPAEVAGWDEVEYNGRQPENLQWLSTNIVSRDDCADAWGSKAYFPIRYTQFCAFTKFGEGACNGDTGGPLIVKDKDGNPLLTGLVSWTGPCAKGYPDVYTKVASYVDWIDSVINN